MGDQDKSSEDPFDVGEQPVEVKDHGCTGDSCWCKQFERRSK